MKKNIYFIGNDFLNISTEGDNLQVCSMQDVVDYCENQEVLGVDTETSGVDWNNDKVIMFQIMIRSFCLKQK